MTRGEHQGKRLAQVPLAYLKWLAKNWIHKEIRDAAKIVVNLRSREVGEKETFFPQFKPSPTTPRKPAVQDFGGPFGKLKEELDSAPAGLF